MVDRSPTEAAVLRCSPLSEPRAHPTSWRPRCLAKESGAHPSRRPPGEAGPASAALL